MWDAAGIVLVGGRSSRMGEPKAALEWHGSTLLRRTTGIVSRATRGPTVVVRAAGQELPGLPSHVEVVDDPQPGMGPLQGIAAGLAVVSGRVSRAFICSTDLPFLHPAFVRAVLRPLRTASGQEGTSGGPEDIADGHAADVALPVAGGFPQPLAAGYLTALAPLAARLVAQERLRPAFLFDQCRVVQLSESALRAADPILAALDPDLDSVLNINEPADYRAARARPAPEITIQCFGTLADGHRGPRVVRAATVARAAATAGIALDGAAAVALNGERVTGDGHTPLVTGDTVFFIGLEAGG